MTPKYYAQLLYEVLESKPADAQDTILSNFRNILIRNKHAHLAPVIQREFEKIQEEKLREKTTYIAAASELSSKQKKQLGRMFPEPLVFSENPRLLGGIALTQKDKVYNATLRKKIEIVKSFVEK